MGTYEINFEDIDRSFQELKKITSNDIDSIDPVV